MLSISDTTFKSVNISTSLGTVALAAIGDDVENETDALALRLRRECLQACPTAVVSVIASCCRLPYRRTHAKSLSVAACAIAKLQTAESKVSLEPLSWPAAYSDVF